MASCTLQPCLKWLQWETVLQKLWCCHPSAAAPLCPTVPAVLPRGRVLEFLLELSISSIPELFLPSAANTILCAAIQEIPVTAPRVWGADKAPEQSPGAACTGRGSKGSLFAFTKSGSPSRAPPGCLTKEQTNKHKYVQWLHPSHRELFVVSGIVQSGFCSCALELFLRRPHWPWCSRQALLWDGSHLSGDGTRGSKVQ